MASVLAVLFLRGEKDKIYQETVSHDYTGLLVFLKSQWILMVLKPTTDQNNVLTFHYWFKFLKIFILNFVIISLFFIYCKSYHILVVVV